MTCPTCLGQGRILPTGPDAETEAGLTSVPCPTCSTPKTFYSIPKTIGKAIWGLLPERKR